MTRSTPTPHEIIERGLDSEDTRFDNGSPEVRQRFELHGVRAAREMHRAEWRATTKAHTRTTTLRFHGAAAPSTRTMR
jgi:hypothetical protein